MTGARRSQRPSKAGTLIGIAAAFIAVASLRGVAATTELVVVDPLSGLAIAGYDPVAYFTDGAPETGRGDLEYVYAGVTWRFRNEGNRAAFKLNPDVYAPLFGGHDPVHLARGVPLPGDPRIWLLRGQRLHLFYTEATRDRFAADAERVMLAAEQQWPRVKRTLTP